MERKTQTIIRTIILALALTNQVLTALGKPVIPIEDSNIEALVTSAITLGAAVWAWWKNNSLTPEAQEADTLLDALKSAGENSDAGEEEINTEARG